MNNNSYGWLNVYKNAVQEKYNLSSNVTHIENIIF